jgi:ribonuclease HI
VSGWKARGWRRREGTIENLALWQELESAAAPHDLHWQWVRGHAGHPQNEYANDLAVAAAKTQTSSNGARTSEFDQWLEAQRVKRRVMIAPAPFPLGDTFRPSRTQPRGGAATRSQTPP